MKNLQSCIDSCAASALASRAAAAECLQNPGTLELGRLCLDSAALCEVTFEVVSRHSLHLGDFCALNRHITQLCAAQCAPLAEGSALLSRCRDACLRCAAECQEHAGEGDIGDWAPPFSLS